MAKAQQYQKHNVTTYHKTINEIDEWQGRSFNAKAFHTMLVSYATEGSINSYNAAVTFLEKNRSNTSFLKEVSINGFTHLHDAIHLPFKSEKLPEEKRKEVALSLINLITNYANPEIMAFLLTSRNQEGFSVLMDAVKNGNEQVVGRVVALYEKHPEILEEQLKSRNAEGFSVLMQAVKNGNEQVVGRVVSLYKKHPEILEEQLKSQNAEGFSVFMSAVKNGNEQVVKQIVALYEKHPEILEEQLKSRNAEGFSVLMDAVKNSNEQVVGRVIAFS